MALSGRAISEKNMFDYYGHVHVYIPGAGTDYYGHIHVYIPGQGQTTHGVKVCD